MKVRDKINETALVICNADGWEVENGFDFSTTEEPRPNRYWKIALNVWTVITGDTPDLEADWDDDDDDDS